MDEEARGGTDGGNLYSYEAIMERGSEELKTIVQTLTNAVRPGTDPRTGKLYQIKWRD